MSDLNDLIESIATSLHSYTGIQEQSTYLTAAATASDLSLTVASSDGVKKGITEIEDELVYVDVADANVLSLPPFGRGYRGSTAATHAINTQVTFDPFFPRVEIRRAIDQCIAGLYPRLYQIKSTDLTYVTLPIGYDLPADCEKVLEVKWHSADDPIDYWAPLYDWSFDPTSPEVNGRALNLFDSVLPGSTIRVVYMARFGTFAAGTDTLASVGLQESWADLILYCVTSRMVRFLDPSRLQVTSVENLSRGSLVAAGDAGKIANQLYAMYQQRLIEERSALLGLTPPSINFTR